MSRTLRFILPSVSGTPGIQQTLQQAVGARLVVPCSTPTNTSRPIPIAAMDSPATWTLA